MPVNEYKIADKIIAANKSLFQCGDQNEPQLPETIEKRENEPNLIVKKPRVTFSSDIEEYGDEDESGSTQSNEESCDETVDEPEPSATEETLANQFPKENGENSQADAEMIRDESMDNMRDKTMEYIEEICEDIDVIKLDHKEEGEITEEIDEIPNANESVAISHPELEAIDLNEYPIVENMDIIETLANESSQNTVVAIEELTKSDPKPRASNSARFNSSKAAKLSLKPRKASSNPSSRKGSSASSKAQNSQNTINNINNDDLLRIQLNFKCCCEHKYLENSRLPRYQGYFSQYGLSKEELEARAERKELLRKMKYENWLRKNEEKEMKTLINEHAYSQWLSEKSRNVRRKDKNMYDYDIHGKRLPRKLHKGVVHAESWKY